MEQFAQYLAEGQEPAVTEGDPATWPQVWATEILPLAKSAHDKLRITGTAILKTERGPENGWEVVANDPQKYNDFVADSTTDELRKAGFRLAQTLRAIRPGSDER